MMAKERPTVSVWMITYNHEKYISQAIESVLMQKTDFAIELVIGEDKSTDRTSEIIRKYEIAYPKLIRVRYNTVNLGIINNMIQTIGDCTGKYVALLEGDDYWTSPDKLQKQIDFLEVNTTASFCFHNAMVIHEDSNKPKHLFFESCKNRYYSGKEIISGWIVPTASVVFRNFKIIWPKFTQRCVHGDILLFLLLLEQGEAFGFQDIFSVYRKNEFSVTVSNSNNPEYLKNVLRQHKNMDMVFKGKYKDEFNQTKKYWNLAVLNSYKRNRKYLSFLSKLLYCVICYPSHFFSFKASKNEETIGQIR